MSEEYENNVRVVDFEMPFWSMVTFMIKWAIASIPALVILLCALFGVVGFLGGLSALTGVQ